MTPQEKVALMGALQDMAACYSKPYTPEALDSVIDGLEDLPLATALVGVRAAKQTCKYRPSVAHIREAVRAHQSMRRADVSPAARAALANGEIYCQTCHDTGWAWGDRETGVPLEAPPVGSHGDYRVRVCPCRQTNPLYHAKRQQEGRQHRE